MNESTIQTDWEGLKRMSKEFFDALPSLDEAGLENGFKAFSLAYLGCRFPDDALGRSRELAAAPALMRIVSRQYFSRLHELVPRQAKERL